MPFLKDNISWIAPTAAIVLVASGFLDSDSGFRLFKSEPDQVVSESIVQDIKVATQSEPRVQRLNSLVEAAMDEERPVAHSSDQVADVVTRSAPVDLLQVAPQPETAALAPQPLPKVDQNEAADFFNNAQNNLAVANACGEDLKTLAAQARVYFPTGAAAGDENGLNAARLIAVVARDCPGFSIQVEGHSDPSGDPVTNQRLSEKRAETVISRLGASGIDTSNFVAVGFGDTRPSGVTGPKGRPYYDRRVEFSIIETAQRASFSARPNVWSSNPSSCAQQLENKAQQMRQFYAPGSITVPVNELDAVFSLASEVTRCDGARLRLVGQHSDGPGSRENIATGRLRALAMMSSLVAAGYPSDQILIGAPSYSVNVPGQPGLPNSRIDFQVISD